MDPYCAPDRPPQRDIREMIYRFVRDPLCYMSPGNGYSQSPESLLMYFIQYCQQQGFNFDGRYSNRIVEKVVESDPIYKELLTRITDEMGVPEGADTVGWLKSIAEARDEAQEELVKKETELRKSKPENKKYTDCFWVVDTDSRQLFCTTHEKYDQSTTDSNYHD